ncbi:Sodium- and chloride-dependent glycine transporter 2 [Trichinella britovi]|uniref:Sodium-and chloride-dependent glycine transporter 2 n=1 Tax=Trichinella britovi TaxID=45882 RepID=A0A0V1D0X0_TRIBR|nr:Sodium- and chloride-dependent glycine transporter 2 [Trichinella britovi]
MQSVRPIISDSFSREREYEISLIRVGIFVAVVVKFANCRFSFLFLVLKVNTVAKWWSRESLVFRPLSSDVAEWPIDVSVCLSPVVFFGVRIALSSVLGKITPQLIVCRQICDSAKNLITKKHVVLCCVVCLMSATNQSSSFVRSSSGRSKGTLAERKGLLNNMSMFEQAVPLDESRGQWSKKLDYILSMVGYSVGLSNIWRFPYLCYQNGGGVGWATIVITLMVSTYFNVIIAYSLMFFFESLTMKALPWSLCGNWWNTENCLDYNNASIYESYMRYRSWERNHSAVDYEDIFSSFVNRTIRSPSEEYFNNRVLNISSGIDNMGGLVNHLIPCLFASWLITATCLIKGVKSSGKVVYFTAIFPYFLLTVLLVRGVTLEGATTGIMYYVKPNFTRLVEPRVWSDAAFQVFFSLGPGWGGLITMGSYNRFDNNCLRDSYILPMIMELTSFFAGFVVFSVIGFMAHVTGKKIEEVVAEGPGLAFVTYPEVVSRMPMSQLWAALFFFMVLTVGVDSVFVMVETAITAAHDELKIKKKLKVKRIYILLGACCFMFVCGLAFITKGGMYLLHLVDQYCAFLTVVIICFIELISFAWIYGIKAIFTGAERILSDFEFMIGKSLSPFWPVFWRFATTAVVVAIFFVSVFQYSAELKMGDDYRYPAWSIALGWCISCSSLVLIFVYMIWKLYDTPGETLRQKIRNCTQPTKRWGPANPTIRMEWEAYKNTTKYKQTLKQRLHKFYQRSPLQKYREQMSRTAV